MWLIFFCVKLLEGIFLKDQNVSFESLSQAFIKLRMEIILDLRSSFLNELTNNLSIASFIIGKSMRIKLLGILALFQRHFQVIVKAYNKILQPSELNHY